MERWGPGAVSSRKKERVDVRELAERRKVKLKQARVGRGCTSITVSSF
jgi:hypothetical protein